MIEAATVAAGRAGRFILAEPAKAALEHGNQALVTSAAAYMSAMFSMQHNVLPWFIAWPLAVGFEWTYLRGLATADRTTHGGWAGALNWVAMITSMVYGVLYILGVYLVIPEHPTAGAAVGLALAHVVPMTLLSFCYAGVRRAYQTERRATEDERRRHEELRLRELQRQQDVIELERQRKLADLDVWRQGRTAQFEMQMQGASAQNAPSPHQEAGNAGPPVHTCPHCGASLNVKQFAAAKRWGHCAACKNR